MRKYVILLILFAISNLTNAQKIIVDTFLLEPNQTLRSDKEWVFDRLGDPCALIKVQMVENEIYFEGAVDTVQHGKNEWWVWMPYESKRLKIYAGSGTPCTVIFSEHNITIEKKRSYILILKREESKKDTIYQVIVDNTKQKREKPYNHSNTLAFFESAIIPGLGQWHKGYAGHGTANMLGEAALIGGAVYFYNLAQKISNQGLLDAENVSNYNRNVTTYNVFLGAAIALYTFNLLQAVIIKPKDYYYTAVSPTLLPVGNTLTPGIGLTLNF